VFVLIVDWFLRSHGVKFLNYRQLLMIKNARELFKIVIDV